MQEGNATSQPVARRGIEQTDAARVEIGERTVHVAGLEAEVVKTLTTPGEKAAHRRLGP
jgi:hypothetical protein